MIQLGLARAARLFQPNPQPWKAIHVAGTNGKGSTCAYISALLHASGVRCGRFTSPHLIDKWDCITIAEKPVSRALFEAAEADIRALNAREGVGATEFELLTATAFSIFTSEAVDVGVVEVGLGGRLDATNVLKHKSATVIARIGLDHTGILGNDLATIAREKCGIFAPKVPVIYNGSNEPEVVSVIKECAAAVDAGPLIRCTKLPRLGLQTYPKFHKAVRARRQQRLAISCAFQAAKVVLDQLDSTPPNNVIVRAIVSTSFPGRMQMVDLAPLLGRPIIALVDGAHNEQAAQALDYALVGELRELYTGRLRWVIGASAGKDLAAIAGHLLRCNDAVAAVEFGSVDGMPWVQPMKADDVAATIDGLDQGVTVQVFGTDVKAALDWAAGDGSVPVVVTGSLYLVGDVLRLLRDAGFTVKAQKGRERA
ncbi:folylpolyglutamate synthase [Trichodelitschia bisporula]|uniref:Folylpolyglutamate synthase n=1 Tax=Trichodelitschia bisporula TaxID=703511 RepID=A0A6G1IB55_9PEZI|nr:folylpolyglutamate synthase [Trichodelitschia bisporula]